MSPENNPSCVGLPLKKLLDFLGPQSLFVKNVVSLFMKKILFRFGVLFCLALGLLQFWRPARNESLALSPTDLTLQYPVPAPVLALLKRACYDCHSNYTAYPWYANIQPVSWWLTQHVNEGKQHLNFSVFGAYSAKRAGKNAEEIADEVTHHDMPLPSYTWLHPEARLTPAEIKLLVDWANALTDQLAEN